MEKEQPFPQEDKQPNIQSHSSHGDDAEEQEAKDKVYKMLVVDGELTDRVLMNIYKITKTVYSQEIAVHINKHCLKLQDRLRLRGNQWNNIYRQYNTFITPDAFNKKDKKSLEHSENNLIEKLSSLYDVEMGEVPAIKELRERRQEQDKQFRELAEKRAEQNKRLRALDAKTARKRNEMQKNEEIIAKLQAHLKYKNEERKCLLKEISYQITIDSALAKNTITNLRNISERTYGFATSIEINELCLNLHNKLHLDRQQWDNIFSKFDKFIADDASNKRRGKPLQYSKDDLIKKISSLYALEKSQIKEIKYYEKQLAKQRKNLRQKNKLIANLKAQTASHDPNPTLLEPTENFNSITEQPSHQEDNHPNTFSQHIDEDAYEEYLKEANKKLDNITEFDSQFIQKAITDIHCLTTSIYSEKISSDISEHCLRLHKRLQLKGKQWNNIFNQFKTFIDEDTFNKKSGNAFQYNGTDLIEKISSLFKIETRHVEEIKHYEEQLVCQQDELQQKDELITKLETQIMSHSPNATNPTFFNSVRPVGKRNKPSSSNEDEQLFKRHRAHDQPITEPVNKFV